MPAYSSRLAEALRRLARLKLDAGDAAGAVADAGRAVALLEGLTSRDGGQWFGLACAGRRWPQPPAARGMPGPPMPAPWLTGQWATSAAPRPWALATRPSTVTSRHSARCGPAPTSAC